MEIDEKVLKDKVRNQRFSILVNSCDAYEDLWVPFFTLLKKYWHPLDAEIILNTETKTFTMEGLDIHCIHPEHFNGTYGERMLNVLSKVNTKYVIPLLDDFFLRKEVDISMINQIMDWMDQDSKIVYFNCDDTPVYASWEEEKYKGFHRIPYGNVYTLNMQAAVWRTDKLMSYWREKVSPWDWEEYCNLSAARQKKDKFYCVSQYGNGFCDYGYKLSGMGVHHGRWVRDDVVPLFEKENISVDFSNRGFLDMDKQDANSSVFRDTFKHVSPKSSLIQRCFGWRESIRYHVFLKRQSMVRQFKMMPETLYIQYQLLKEREKFLKKKKREERVNKLKNLGLVEVLKEKGKRNGQR